MNRLVKVILDAWDDPATLPWDALAAEHGEAIAPFAGLAPPATLIDLPYRQQVAIEALGHLGTLQLISRWDLPFLLVKGIAWGAHLWGDLARRPGRDLDVVVPFDALAEWQARLQAAGFQPAPHSPNEWVQGRQIVQLHHDGPSPHWQHRVGPPWQAFRARSRTIAVGPLDVHTPDDADTLLYLAHHQVFRHGLDHELGWLDLAAWLRLPQANVALETALERAAGTHLVGCLTVLAWAWRGIWGQAGLEMAEHAVTPLQRWLCGYLERHPSDAVGQALLMLSLAQGNERRALLEGVWPAFRSWRRWRLAVGDAD